MPYAQLDTVRLYYEEYGQGAPVIFLHGFTLDHRQWRTQIDLFSARYRVILLDSRGHGLSDAPSTGYGRDDRVNDLLAFMDALGITKFHLVGLSRGGVTAIGFALKHQDRLLSLTLVSTGAAGWNNGKKLDRVDQAAREKGVEAARALWLDWSLRYYGERRPELAKELETMMREHSGAIWMDPMRGKYPRTIDLDHVHHIAVPTAIFVGDHDKIFVPLGEELNARIVRSRLYRYPNAGHMLNMEHPDRFNRDLGQFLSDVTGG